MELLPVLVGRGDYDHDDDDDDAVSQAILARRTLELAFFLAVLPLYLSLTHHSQPARLAAGLPR